MARYYRRVELNEKGDTDEPVSLVAVHPLRWGDMKPDCGLIEVSDPIEQLQERCERLEHERNTAFCDAGIYVAALRAYNDPDNWNIVKNVDGRAYAIWTGDLYPRGIAERALCKKAMGQDDC